MQLKFLISSVVVITALSCQAAPITPTEALGRIEKEYGGIRKAKAESTPRLLKTISSANGTPSIYIFTYTGDTGFMIVSADDSVMPMLAYSDEGIHDFTDIPEGVNAWIQNYADQIDDIQKNPQNVNKRAATRAHRESIATMLKTNWKQGHPFNGLCPPWTEGGFKENSLAGCVGLAVAQMTTYWRYPSKGYGFIQYNWYNETKGPELSLNADEIFIDWDNICDSYVYGSGYTPEQKDAMNELIQLCSYAVYSEFGYYATGAKAENVRDRIVEFLGFSEEAVSDFRSNYEEQAEWEDLLHASLVNYGPIVYAGYSGGSGHCFVMDGYDAHTQRFHFNWGWEGVYNGYYTLTTLGAGGNSFANSQRCAYNIRPADPEIMPVSMMINGVEMDKLPTTPKEEMPLYLLDDPTELEIEFGFEMSKGVLDSPITATVYDIDPETEELGKEISTDQLGDAINLRLGFEKINHTLTLPNDDQKMYAIALKYENKWHNDPVTFAMFKTASSKITTGLNSISANTNAVPIYFNLQGIKISNPSAGEILIRKTGDKTEKIVY